MIKLSGVTMTLNEERNIARCLSSMSQVADELLVVDCFSTDRTIEIASGLGARILQHPMEGFREQRKFTVDSAQFDYVLLLDADEVLSDELVESILRVKEDWSADCYHINRLNRMGDRWIRHGAWYPDRLYRLFDRRKIFVGGTNPHDRFIPVEGARTTRIRGDILHYTSENYHDRMFKENRASSDAAEAYFNLGKKGSYGRLLFKPGFRFLKEYIFKGGFRDGFYGYLIARSSAQYVFLREAKLMERWRKNKAKRSVPEAE